MEANLVIVCCESCGLVMGAPKGSPYPPRYIQCFNANCPESGQLYLWPRMRLEKARFAHIYGHIEPIEPLAAKNNDHEHDGA